MTVYKVRYEIPAANGIAKDMSVATFHFQAADGGPDVDIAQQIGGHVAACFIEEDAAWSPYSVAELYSDLMSRTVAPMIKVYDADAGGSPVWQGAAAAPLPAALSATDFPPQVSVVLSYRGSLTNIPEEAPDDGDPDNRPERPASRRRGRFFCGPLAYLAPNADGTVPNLLRNTLLHFGTELADIPAGDLTAVGAEWVVWSEPHPGYAGLVTPVVSVSCDNAWDTQRRRRRAATSRIHQAV